MVGVTVGTMALIIVLSVFNGFEILISSLFNSFNPDLEISAVKGKTFHYTEIQVEEIRAIPGIYVLTEVVEENALLIYRDKEYLATIKGVSREFESMSGLDTKLIQGQFALWEGKRPKMVMGAGVAYFLNAALHDLSNPISVNVPRREGNMSINIRQDFNSKNIFPSAIFSIQQDFDVKYAVVPIEFARELLDYSDEVTAVEVGLEPGADTELVKEKMKEILGPDSLVKNRFEQQALLHKIMKTEKWAIFLILTFILIIATFNVIGSLTMLILDKEKDIAVLHSMGATNQLIRRIFMMEGVMISIGGALTGLILGAIVSWLQQTFGFIALGSEGGTFVVNAYPVQLRLTDFLYVFITVITTGFIAAWYPVKQISKKYLHQKL